MFSKIRSLIFKLDPEMAHDLAIKSLKFNFVFKMGSFLFSSNIFETKLSLSDWIAKKCALSGSILNIKDLKFEYIILIY